MVSYRIVNYRNQVRPFSALYLPVRVMTPICEDHGNELLCLIPEPRMKGRENQNRGECAPRRGSAAPSKQSEMPRIANGRTQGDATFRQTKRITRACICEIYHETWLYCANFHSCFSGVCGHVPNFSRLVRA